ncbi:arginine--tRNA ligase [Ornithinibacillus bavariensis]|uniref:Arginine--tRNA ligase n=1 Tax=Ornithinibacillus bavariensis TaxID=545502 RepID=A0A920C4N6_9BACI|nr:arginine--tRNA ligase [Ornithinibacillus bavariensis]GIO25825.1 arginine--tRNA ligase 1 [Ornithinibacillus bavariensis]
MNYKQEFANALEQILDGVLSLEEILSMIEKPKFNHMGDSAFPCFQLAKIYRQSPKTISEEITQKVNVPLFEKVEATGGYVNVFLNKKYVTKQTLELIFSEKERYGSFHVGCGKTITIDYSSPNIAKPFSMGHLRSTVIGNSLSLIAEKHGYHVIRINHLGDWGTQFGKLIVAYKKWGDEEKVKRSPIKELLALYVKFHEEAEKDPILNDLGREAFKLLENGDKEAMDLWEWFRDESLKEFMKIYDLLGITFDSYHGEAFYNDKMEQVVDLLTEKGLLVESDGANVVQLENFPPCLIKKRDGTTLYATRDLAAAIYRQDNYHFDKSIYVVGNEQTLHFKQLFAVLEKLGFSWQKGMTHVPFGMILRDGKKMSTRKGKVVLLENVIKEAIQLALANIEEKNPNLIDKEEIAKQVGVGAIIFHDLKNGRMNDIEFSLEDMLRFEGETGPYVQYTHARAAALLRKGNYVRETDYKIELHDEEAWQIIKELLSFPEAIERAMLGLDPSQIAKCLLDLSKAFNKYYASVKILEESHKQDRLSLVFAVKTVLKEGLRLLGIQAPEQM